ncbi:DUF397 domain-containing protein [Actinokineospora sp. 24-640]
MSTVDSGWFKSSFSAGASDQCVECRMTGWTKSSFSNAGGDNCVEYRSTCEVQVRDSKNPQGARSCTSPRPPGRGSSRPSDPVSRRR